MHYNTFFFTNKMLCGSGINVDIQTLQQYSLVIKVILVITYNLYRI